MPYAKNYPFHPRPNEKDLPLITPYIPGEEEILDVMFAPQKDLISEEEWFRALKNKWMLDPYGQGLFDYDEKGRNPAGNTTRDPLYEGTGLENFQLRKSDMEENMGEKSVGIFEGKQHEIPEEYKLKENVEYSENIKRYLWRPQPGDYIYYPDSDNIVRYEKWADRTPEGGMGGLDGVCLITIISGPDENESFWMNNLDARKGMPIEKIALKKTEENMGEKKLAQEYTTKQIYNLLDEHILPGCSYNLRKDPNIDCWRVQIFNDKLLDEMGITAPYIQFHLPFVMYRKEDMIKKFKEGCEDALKLEEEMKTESLKKKAVQYGELEDMAQGFSPEETEKIIEKGGELMDIDYKFIKEKELEGEKYQKLVNSNIPLSDPEANELRKIYLNHIKEQVTEKIPAITYLLLEDNNYHLLNEALVYLDLFEPSIDNITFYHFEEYEPEKLSHKANEEQPKSRVDEMWEKMNDNEQFGCQFGMFPSWLYDEYKPTHEEIVELMGKGTPNVNASKKLAQKEVVEAIFYYDGFYEMNGKGIEYVLVDGEELSLEEWNELFMEDLFEHFPDAAGEFSYYFTTISNVGGFDIALDADIDEIGEELFDEMQEYVFQNYTFRGYNLKGDVLTTKKLAQESEKIYWKDIPEDGVIQIDKSTNEFYFNGKLIYWHGDEKEEAMSFLDEHEWTYASKKLAQDFDTTRGRPTVEHDEPTGLGEEKPEEEIGEEFFEEGEVPMGKITHAPGEMPTKFPEKKPIEPERNLLKQLTPMDMKEYTAMVDERSRAEAQGDLSKADYLNNAIRELLNKYKESPGTLNEMSPASFVGRKMKAHTMLNKGDYQKIIKSVGEKLTELRRDMSLKISSASVYRIDRESDEKATVDFTMDLMMDNFNSKNIMVRAFKEGDVIEIHPYFWDSLGKEYHFDEAGIKKLFNLQRTDKKIIDEFKTKEKEEK